MANIYIAPAAGSNSGSGTIGSPYTGSTLAATQYAFNNVTQGTNGDQFNIQANGTNDVLTAILNLATYGTPTASKPLLLRGYTTVANDGGIGVISGGASFGIISSSAAGIVFGDMRLTNCGAAIVASLTGGQSGFVNCEVDTSTGNGLVASSGSGFAHRCYVHDIGGSIGINVGMAFFNRFESLTKNPTTALTITSTAYANSIALTGSANTSNGIACGVGNSIIGNSIWANGGKGTAINPAGLQMTTIYSNIIEGFSGTGGKGVNGTAPIALYGGNYFFNNASNTPFTGAIVYSVGSDTTTGSSSFNNPSGTPADLSLSTAGKTNVGNAFPGAYCGGTGFSTASPFTSYRLAGAVQPQASASSGAVPFFDGMLGGCNG